MSVMDDNDPISDSTPNKRRKLNKAWDSADDSGDELSPEDFEASATLPLSKPLNNGRPQLQYTPQQFHTDLHTLNARSSSPPRTFVTQPTQTLHANTTSQPTQPLPPKTNGNVQVERSSPIAGSSPRPQLPPPISRAPFAKPGSGFLASAIAPAGTAFRQPFGVQSRPAPAPAPAAAAVTIDSDDEIPDPPVHYSSDEETQGLSSNLKPTNFKKGGRGLDSTPNRSDAVVKESPNGRYFSNLMSEFEYKAPSSAWRSDDLASAYGNVSRAPRPAVQRAPSRAAPVAKPKEFERIEDVPDADMRNKIRQIQRTLDYESVQRCYEALLEKKRHVPDAIEWLLADEEQDAPGEEDDEVDELASTTPVVKRGVAVSRSMSQSSQPVRPAAKQEVKVPVLTIAEKYGSTQAARKPSLASPDDEVVQPRRRLQQGRKTRSPTPPSSPAQKPAQPLQRLKRAEVIEIDDDDDVLSEAESGLGDEGVAETDFDRRLLNFFNTCSVQDLTDLSTQPEDVVKLVIDKRPFASLDVIRTISNVTETKSGKKSRSRPVGDKIVGICSEVFTGYDAIDELVKQCESIGKPIRDALKGWGGAASPHDGELQLMNLDEAHDSGIGTPSSSSDDIPVPRGSKSAKGRFLGQPESMNSEASLKDYQLVGLNWLNLLYSRKLSCILADEMGLGKTCQVIAFLAHLQQQHVDGVHLVIVPGSTLENWLREFEFFAPSLRVRPYYGSQKEREDLREYIVAEMDDIDVIVTTYDMAVKPDDNKFLRKYIDPHVCVYDEAHQLRNAQSDRYKQLTRIPSSFRVLLTGTPLQNNLQELVAILGFIMPSLFQEKRAELHYIFQHKASTKDEDHAALLSAQRIARARSMMTPFILRRKKVQVLDLPKKVNRLEYCDMTPAQRKYYAELVDEAQEYFTQRASGKRVGTKASAKASSNVLMSLRKAAIHPLLARRIYDDAKIDKIVTLLLKNPEFAENTAERTRDYLIGEHHQSFKGGDYGLHTFCRDRPYLQKFALKKKEWMDAGKIEIFRKLVSEFAVNGDRVLVFSQFTTMMNILEAVLETMNIKFLRLDGSTDMQIRQTMIDQFTNDESITLFMLSTRAGGAGINLACANKVIIFDSGFNPQDDIQAENRAHRVGQTRDVEVVRLVTRGTIEEQIHALGESKIALDERVAGEGATAAEEKQAEKAGEQMVEKMFLESLKKEDVKDDIKEEVVDSEAPTSELDLKDMFKSGLEGAGLKVASKQAQF